MCRLVAVVGESRVIYHRLVEVVRGRWAHLKPQAPPLSDLLLCGLRRHLAMALLGTHLDDISRYAFPILKHLFGRVLVWPSSAAASTTCPTTCQRSTHLGWNAICACRWDGSHRIVWLLDACC